MATVPLNLNSPLGLFYQSFYTFKLTNAGIIIMLIVKCDQLTNYKTVLIFCVNSSITGNYKSIVRVYNVS